MNVYLCKMTEPLLQQFFQGFANDPDLFSDMNHFTAYTYSETAVNERWERQRQLRRIHLAVMLEQEPIGEVILKNLDSEKGYCTLSIHMKNNSVKNRGFGTQAEILALEYAFGSLGMETVFADAVHKNKRSQHVLEKVGFQKIREDMQFVYYRCEKETWGGLHSDTQVSKV